MIAHAAPSPPGVRSWLCHACFVPQVGRLVGCLAHPSLTLTESINNKQERPQGQRLRLGLRLQDGHKTQLFSAPPLALRLSLRFS